MRWSKDSVAEAKKTDLPLFLMVECSAGPCRHLEILPMYHKRSSSTLCNRYVGEGEDVIQEQRFLQRFLGLFAPLNYRLLLAMANTET